MEVQKDFKELLESFGRNGVEFLIVGGYALAFHGAPRFTGDIDLYVRPSGPNAGRILEALEQFGFGGVGLSKADFTEPGKVVQLGFPPVRIDLITSLAGVTWEEAWSGRNEGDYGGAPVCFIGRAEFLRNKRAAGRTKDLADIEALGEK
jgi:hypothetical protein